MNANNWNLPEPPKKVLDKLHQVLIGNPAFKMWRMKRWCREQNLSLVYSEIVETADVGAEFDHVAAFYFDKARDATMFSLRYK